MAGFFSSPRLSQYVAAADDVVGASRMAESVASTSRFLTRVSMVARSTPTTMIGADTSGSAQAATTPTPPQEPSSLPPAAREVIDRLRRSGVVDDPQIEVGPLTAVGAVAGLAFWGGHRFLGAIGGASLGRNVPALFNADLRGRAARNMGQTGAAILGSLVLPRTPVVGFVVGWLLAGVGTYLVRRGSVGVYLVGGGR